MNPCCLICNQSLTTSPYDEDVSYQCTECIQKKILNKLQPLHVLLQTQQQLQDKLSTMTTTTTSSNSTHFKEQSLQRIQLLKEQIEQLKQVHYHQMLQNKQLQKESNLKQNDLSTAFSVLRQVQNANTKLQNQQQQTNTKMQQTNKSLDKLRKRRRKNCELVMETIPIFIDKYSKDSNKLPQKLYIINHQFWIPLFDDLWSSAMHIHSVGEGIDHHHHPLQEMIPCDAEMISNALGYIVLIVQGLSIALQIELPYKLQYLGNKSTIDQMPLFLKQAKREEFQTAIKYLNTNVNYLCSQLGIVVAVPNLNNFRVNLLCLYLYQHEVCSQMGPFQYGEEKYSLLDNYMMENNQIKVLPVLLHPLFAEKQFMKFGHLLQSTTIQQASEKNHSSLLSKYIKEEYLRE